ncbi:prolyl-tRNA synthetase [Desulfocapsa sulfexigens DSM 10523]|uniref:Proline--tRNA ligase n=1 Tax=Desulfocapsa sulfexigens (strain DSM 10523 / SB164P1) TaxID=1167006 RepID=M1PG32_DESSD|nr:proline--tRNA ligase [Desulfocapsa sulfexigens]AGF78630.1 prolyl-tRNA synthetase [Desulfocapsa sulfexigens DSM 10523]
MRFSKSLIPTLKETPAEAEVVSHRLLLRAGFIRKLTAGIYTYLPLGLAAIRKVEQIVREEMTRAGAQELLMPMVQPADLWHETGRYKKYGPELLRFVDRHDRESCLGPTHEEVITDLARREIRSYRDLPMNLYQIQTKFRDEIRPRFGLMRGREFIMKDAYSFDVDDSTAEESYQCMYDAYKRIFTRCGLEYRPVEADSGTIGGSFSHEFMVLADTGEDTLVICSGCDYAANSEKAVVAAPGRDESPMLPLEKMETPGKRKVSAVCEFMGISPKELVKTMVYKAGEEAVAVLVRGDREVQEVKLKNFLGVVDVEMLDDKDVFAATGVPTGYLGPVGIKVKLLVDNEVAAMCNFVVGANEKNHHLKNVNMGRDFEPFGVADLRQITVDDPCPVCGGVLTMKEGIEVGHVFKLGTGYSKAMNAVFQDSDGQDKPMVMGCYGIGVSRIVAAAIEQNHDENGMIFPMPLAPMQVIVLNLGLKNEQITGAAEALYRDLEEKGIDVLLDDRDERPGSKFKDADLLGIPLRLTVGKRLTQDGVIELRSRRDGKVEELAPQQVVARVRELIEAAMING